MAAKKNPVKKMKRQLTSKTAKGEEASSKKHETGKPPKAPGQKPQMSLGKKLLNPVQSGTVGKHRVHVAVSAKSKATRMEELLKPGAPGFPIVGMGASAGGLEAFEEFFSKMPSDSGIAFILVPHLDPTHATILPDLLKRFTKMPVLQAEDGMSVIPDHVYIIPPNKDMAIYHQSLQLTVPEKSPRGIKLPIDFFLRSLADDQSEMAIGIILSGTGTDGSMGVRAIHAAGGMIMAQDPSSAKYEGMPRSAIDTHLTDYILPPSKMPEQLMAYVKKISSKKGPGVSPAATPTGIQKILMFLRSQTGHDFSLYKKSTLLRRIERRMAVHNLEDPADYVRYLRDHKDEVQLLFRELLITVTSFFRDPEAFDILKTKIWPVLLEGKPLDYTVRIWVPGCSTGEEAYSIAITLKEYMAEMKHDYRVQIFGTDIDEDAINQARTGIYPDNIGIDVSRERLKRFFAMEEGIYRIKKEIREMIVFAVQNVIKDAPFTKLDMVSCRNFLIYVEPEMQNRILPLFHYSLKPGGVLFLGSSESIGHFSDLFRAIDKKWKIFEAKVTGGLAPGLPFTREFEPKALSEEARQPKRPGVADLIQKLLLTRYVPPAVIVDERGDIVYIHGQTGRYLEPAPGQPSLNVIAMAREGLQLELRTCLHHIFTRRGEICRKGLRVRTNGGEQKVDMTVKHLTEAEGMAGYGLITFEEHPPEKPPEVPKKPPAKPQRIPKKHEARIAVLEEELSNTKESLQTTVEEMQAANEELKSANEELQSTNEELQSTNEELETSKEELQSVNEELVTVNSELQGKIDQLSRAENDMKALLDSVHIGALFLSHDLTIKRYTSGVGKLFNLIPSDVGRPITDIRHNLKYDNFVEDCRKIIETLQNREMEIQSTEGRWYLMRLMPTRSAENVIDGLVVTFPEITPARLAREELIKFQQVAHECAEAMIESVKDPMLVIGSDLKVISANRLFYETFNIHLEQIGNPYIYDLGNGLWDIPVLRTHLTDMITEGNDSKEFELEHEFQGIGKKKMRLNARRVSLPLDSDKDTIFLVIKDITPVLKSA